jgi:hypothetical protein
VKVNVRIQESTRFWYLEAGGVEVQQAPLPCLSLMRALFTTGKLLKRHFYFHSCLIMEVGLDGNKYTRR